MTVSSQTNNETFDGNGVTILWDLPFRFFHDNEIFVYLVDPVAFTTTPLSLGTDYTLTGAGLPEQFGTAPGKITTTVPVATLKQLYVERIMGIDQLTDIVNQGRFFPEVHEDVFDRLTMLIQQLSGILDRALVVPPGQIPPSIATILAAEGFAQDAAASAAEAADYAAYARNNWVISGPFTGTGIDADYALSVDPGSVSNMFPIASGVTQMISTGAYSLVYTAGLPYVRINIPAGVEFEVRTSNAVPIATPAIGSVHYDSLDAQLQSAVDKANSALQTLPAGSVAQVVTVYNTTASTVTTGIPADNTVPQNTEGTQVLTGSITPKKIGNRLLVECSLRLQDSVAAPVIAALFQGATASAVAAEIVSVSSASSVVEVTVTYEVVAASLSAITFNVRVGTATAFLPANLFVNSALLGGVNRCSLKITEIVG